MRPFILDLAPELMHEVLGHVECLDDLGSLMLTNRWMADLGRNIRAKTLWRITIRSCNLECLCHDDGPCWCGLVQPALEKPESRPFKVRAWLYRRASVRSFGISEEWLEGCQVILSAEFNPYDLESCAYSCYIGSQLDSDEQYEAKVREWSVLWITFQRYLTMQRVQRVNLGDATVEPYWRRGGVLREMMRKHERNPTTIAAVGRMEGEGGEVRG
jgi:hypothetical protein